MSSDERIVEPVLLVRPDALLPVTAEDVVDLERLPDVDEVVNLFEISDVKTAHPLVGLGLLQEVDDLGLAGRGTANEEDDVKMGVAHGMSLSFG